MSRTTRNGTLLIMLLMSTIDDCMLLLMTNCQHYCEQVIQEMLIKSKLSRLLRCANYGNNRDVITSSLIPFVFITLNIYLQTTYTYVEVSSV